LQDNIILQKNKKTLHNIFEVTEVELYEEMIRVFEKMGSSGRARHDF